MPDNQMTMQEGMERAKGRKLRFPINFIVQTPASNKPIIIGGVPRVRMQMEKIEIETIGDIAEFYRQIGQGKMHPVPDLSLQVLNIMLDLLGLIEPVEESVGASDVGEAAAGGN